MGTSTHGMWMIFMDNIPLWERISSLNLIVGYFLIPFIIYLTIRFLRSFIYGRGDQMFYYACIISWLSTFYKFLLPCRVDLTGKETAKFYTYFFVYIALSPWVALCIICNSFYNMNDFSWGKTRMVEEVKKVDLLTDKKMIPDDINTDEN